MKLVYTSPKRKGALALPEGWPAADHDEPDAAVAAAKVAAGSYERANAPRGRGATEPAEAGEGDS